MISRRRLIGSGAALTLGWRAAPVLGDAPPSGGNAREPRFVLLILRGGMDGLAAVPAHGDPHFRDARGQLADPVSADRSRSAAPAAPVLDLDGFFGLHPSFERLGALYGQRELAVVHATAPPYWKRSHFDAQEVLEAGIPNPSGSSDGWLYRALTLMPGDREPAQHAMALGGAVPLVLRGARAVGGWMPDRIPDPDADTLEALLALYREDAVLGPRLQAALRSDRIVKPGQTPERGALAVAATAAAEFLGHPAGPRLAVIESGGWDTHANQSVQLASRFRALDDVVGELRGALGPVWSETVLLIVTEFGRTVAMNGTRGSDHGVGGTAFVAGGPVRGGRVLGDWPGLHAGARYEGRDLRPTTDVRAIFKTVLVEHLGIDAGAVDERVFPDVRLPILKGLCC